jgi:hypothetical protein
MIDEKQPENLECFKFLRYVITIARCAKEIQSRTAMARAAFIK